MSDTPPHTSGQRMHTVRRLHIELAYPLAYYMTAHLPRHQLLWNLEQSSTLLFTVGSNFICDIFPPDRTPTEIQITTQIARTYPRAKYILTFPNIRTNLRPSHEYQLL